MSRLPPVTAISMGCPSGVGPEVAVIGAVAAPAVCGAVRVLVGDVGTLRAAAEVRGVSQARLLDYPASVPEKAGVYVLQAGPTLKAGDRKRGKPGELAGAAQLEAVATALELAKGQGGGALVTGPVNKAAVARSGLRGAKRFLGHTEWLAARDPGRAGVMAFVGGGLATALVTTHLPLSKVPRALNPDGVSHSILALARLVSAMGVKAPRIAVASLNPHAGEEGLLGGEEARAIAPGVARAQRFVGRRARIHGPMGAETAFRRHRAGDYDGVVAMYHDQATIPMKLLAFGEAVNVTVGLSFVRTSVDHGTGYDIAWKGAADASGMAAAIELGEQLARARGYTKDLWLKPPSRSKGR